MIVWLGTGMDTIIAAGISVAIFGAIINLYTGFLQADPKKLLLIRTLGNMKVNMGLSLVGVVIGEFLAARRGLGYLIIYGSQVLQLDMLITSILLLCIIAMELYQLLQLAEHCYKKKV